MLTALRNFLAFFRATYSPHATHTQFSTPLISRRWKTKQESLNSEIAQLFSDSLTLFCFSLLSSRRER